MSIFKTFLTEKLTDESKLTHLEHVEDHVIHGGEAGFAHAFHNLQDVHHALTGGKNDTKITTKYDGSPSIVFGYHPDNGKFFVGSKSVFNKDPKINHTAADIQKNHGHAPGLVSKLNAALKHLPKVTPKGGVYQADIMHTLGDVKREGNHVHFTPQLLTYKTEHNSEHGQKALNSHIGVAVHTQYEGKNFANMKAKYAPETEDFADHDDVHVIHTHKNLGKVSYTLSDQEEYKKHLDDAVKHFKSAKSGVFEHGMKHEENIKQYINHNMRTGTNYSHDDFLNFRKEKHLKGIGKVKTDAAKERKTAAMNAELKHHTQNKDHLDHLMKLHTSLQSAKDVLTRALSTHNELQTELQGTGTKGEGFVVVKNNRPSKFVDRREFSAANFNK